jgi:hypothetical protein
VRRTDGLHHHIGIETVGECGDHHFRILRAAVFDDVGAELSGRLDATGAKQSDGRDCGGADGACPDDDNNVGGPDTCVDHTHLVGSEQDAGPHQHLFVGDSVGHRVG